MTTILKNLGLILASSILLYASWPPSQFGPIVFIALIPLLYFVDSEKTEKPLKKYFILFFGILTALFCFGFLTAYNAWGEYNKQSFIPILMCFVPLSAFIALYGFFKKKSFGFLFLIFGWGTMELFQMNWDMNSPLLMLGNSLSYYPSLIQHYAVWGVTGGSMYIVVINVLFYYIIKKLVKNESLKRVKYFSFIFIPIIASILFFNYSKLDSKKERIAIVTGHFKHFTKEFANNPYLTIKIYNKIISKSDGLEDVNTVFFPESAVINSGWIENLNKNGLKNPLDSLCAGKQIFLGSHVFSVYHGDLSEKTYNINYDEVSKVYYLKHNCSIYRSASGNYQVKSKDKFVSFHEIKPYPKLLGFLADFLNKDVNPTYLSPYEKSIQKPIKTNSGIKIFSIVCFESFFSDVIVMQNEANFIAVLANEFWNYQDKGKEQYFSYMIPKAIESGKSIVKVSNGGYSGWINSKGQVSSKVGYDKPQVVKMDVIVENTSSFYSRNFNEINMLIITITVLLFGYLIFSLKRYSLK